MNLVINDAESVAVNGLILQVEKLPFMLQEEGVFRDFAPPVTSPLHAVPPTLKGVLTVRKCFFEKLPRKGSHSFMGNFRTLCANNR